MRISYQSVSLAVTIGLVAAFAWQQHRMDQLVKVHDAVATATQEEATHQAPHLGASAETTGDAQRQVAALTETITALRTEIAALETRVETMEARATPQAPTFRPRMRPTPPPPSVEEGERMHALREDVDALLTGAGVESQEGQDLVATLVDQQRQQARAERHARWQRIRTEADEAWIEDFRDEAELDDDQMEGLRGLLAEHRDEKRALRRAMRQGETDFGQVQAQSERLHAELEDAVAQLLSEAQLALFRDSQERRRDAMRKLWH